MEILVIFGYFGLRKQSQFKAKQSQFFRNWPSACHKSVQTNECGTTISFVVSYYRLNLPKWHEKWHLGICLKAGGKKLNSCDKTI